MKNLILILLLVAVGSCQNQDIESPKTDDKVVKKKTRPISLENGKFFEVEGRKMLYGGTDSLQHFDITDYMLNDAQFHYGRGRESFPALLEPEFTSIQEVDSLWDDDARFLVAYKGGEVKAYSVKDLTRHEVVNDKIDGTPIMAAYCILADLGAIYERDYGGQELTFALSGYTYYDTTVWNGLDGFVLWDRETESLWWPLIDQSVSGPLQGTQLLEMDKANWSDVTWKEVKSNYPTAKVLISGQDFERPTEWDKKVDASYIIENFKKI
jgi:hypothetical protein